ncbi:MAG: hypothetical protein H0T89_35605 [Deltaproteobacteria bacterium]|nr:hypothetical protein [Deltaproteobacteria bacterium]MDQ3296567.1 hypothetical protein [Myxococcota bacterium]
MERFDRFPRGTLPPSAYVDLERGAPRTVERPPTTLEVTNAPTATPRGTCDLASTCPNCSTLMQPEHAHYRCATCGYRDSCCF